MKRAVTLLQIGVIVVSAAYFLTSASPSKAAVTIRPAECKIYAMEDRDSADSHFVVIDPNTFSLEVFGGPYNDADFESLEIDPTTRIMYTVTSKSNPILYRADGSTTDFSGIEAVGPITSGYDDIQGLAFTASGELWAVANQEDLIKLDKNTGAVLLSKKMNKDVDIKGIAWAPDDSYLYGVEEDTMYRITVHEDNPADATLVELSGKLDDESEMLEMRPDGLLMVGKNGGDGGIVLTYDPANGDIEEVPISDPDGILSDVEGFSWPGESCGNPFEPTPTAGPSITVTPTPTPTPLLENQVVLRGIFVSTAENERASGADAGFVFSRDITTSDGTPDIFIENNSSLGERFTDLLGSALVTWVESSVEE